MNPTDDPFEGLVNALRKVLQSTRHLNGTSVTTTPPPAHTVAPPPAHTASSRVNPAPSSTEDFYGFRPQRTLNLPTQPLWFLEESAKVATFADFPAPPSGFKFGGSSSDASSGAFLFGKVPTAFGDSTAPPSGSKFGGSSSGASSGAFIFGGIPTAFVDSTVPPSGFKFGDSSLGASSGAVKFGGIPTDFVDSTAPPSGCRFGGSSSYASTGAFRFGGVPTDYTSTGSSSAGGFGFPRMAFHW